MSNRVVVTGMGVVSPNAHGLSDFETALREGRSGIRLIEGLKEMGFACWVGGIPQGIEEKAPNYFTEEELLSMNETMIFGGVAAIDAWKDAGLPDVRNTDVVDYDTGAVVGLGMSGMDTIVKKVIPVVSAGKVKRLGSTIVEQVMASNVSAKLSGIFGLGNQVTTNSSACNTGTEAIVHAYHRIKDGYAKRMIAGSVEGSSAHTWAGFDAMKVLCSKFNESPEKASRPLSNSAAGFIPGSGAGILILEEYETAKARGAKIYGEIIGGCVNSGGHRNGGSMTAPNRLAVQQCIRSAISSSGIQPEDIDAINGHLTGTFADPMEVENWAISLGYENTPERLPPINATKSLIGHGLGAAGGIECVAALLQLSKGFLHKSLNSEDIHERIKPFESSVVRETQEKPIRVLAKASFGFGDVNGCILFGRIA